MQGPLPPFFGLRRTWAACGPRAQPGPGRCALEAPSRPGAACERTRFRACQNHVYFTVTSTSRREEAEANAGEHARHGQHLRASQLLAYATPGVPVPPPVAARTPAPTSRSGKCRSVQGGRTPLIQPRSAPRATHRPSRASCIVHSVKRIIVLLRRLLVHGRASCARAGPWPRHPHLALIDFGEEQAQHSLFILLLARAHTHARTRT